MKNKKCQTRKRMIGKTRKRMMVKKVNQPKVKRDKRIQNLLPKLSLSEFRLLEQSCLTEGIRDHLVVKDGVLIDGYARLEIALKNSLPYKIQEIKLRNDVPLDVWKIEQSLGRRNLSYFQQVEVALKVEKYYAIMAKSNQGFRTDIYGNSTQMISPIDTLQEVADYCTKLTGRKVSRKLVSMIKKIIKIGNNKKYKARRILIEARKGIIPATSAYFRLNDIERGFEVEEKCNSQPFIRNPKAGTYVDQILYGDVLGKMQEMIDNGLKNKISLIFTSPPYFNAQKNYGPNYKPIKKYWDYIDWLGEFMRLSYQLLRPGGRLAINYDNMTNTNKHDEGEDCNHFPTNADLVYKVRELNKKKKTNLLYNREFIWYKQNAGIKSATGSYRTPSMPTHKKNFEYITIWSKDEYRLKKINGKPSDLTDAEYDEFTFSTIPLTNTRSQKKEHPCPFTWQLPYRFIKLFSWPGDIVMDPMCGIGNSCWVSKLLGRSYIGIDSNKYYVSLSRKNCKEATMDWIKVNANKKESNINTSKLKKNTSFIQKKRKKAA